MKSVFGLIASLMILAPSLALANAGMLVYSEYEGVNYVLLVKSHKHDYFEFPGGKREKARDLITSKKQSESRYETALRETMEETRGYLGRQALKNASSKAKYKKIGKTKLYLAKVPYFELDEIRAIKIPVGKKWAVFNEIVDYAWVRLTRVDGLTSKVVRTKNNRQIQLHPSVLEVMQSSDSDFF